ncbi:uncharacterized protein LOC142555907 isoform X4 [Primulina tabacum]|uniref:uncharacterized protein LOC142555907 isoform X4 n=1 Tax=Primulina tabacum TaxID=48773 RepID=UPI003F5A6A0A
MSHFGRSGPPDIRDTYSLLVLNITFRTTADDLFPLFDKYGKVVDVFIPRDRRTGDSRGFAFVRYKYQEEAAKAVDKLDGRVVDGREIMVQFAKYGPDAEKINKGRISEPVYKSRRRSRSRSPRPRDRDRRHHGRSRSQSWSGSRSPAYRRDRGRGKYNDERRSRSRSYGSTIDSASPVHRSLSPRRSPSPMRSLARDESPDAKNHKERSATPKSVSPRVIRDGSQSPFPGSEADE